MWGKHSIVKPKVEHPVIGFDMEIKLGYKKCIRNFLSGPAFKIKVSDPDFIGIQGLSLSQKPETLDMPSLRTSRSEPGYVPKQRYGGPESFSFAYHSSQENQQGAKKTCYRVLTYNVNGSKRRLRDIVDGTKIKDYGDKLNKNILVFDSKTAALSENFSPTQYKVSRGGNGRLPRVLVSFECWGTSTKRNGGGSSSFIFEYAKFMGIIKCLDAPHPISRKESDIPNPPCYYPGSDHCEPPRLRNSASVRINRQI
jgi:hypothetical protein